MVRLESRGKTGSDVRGAVSAYFGVAEGAGAVGLGAAAGGVALGVAAVAVGTGAEGTVAEGVGGEAAGVPAGGGVAEASGAGWAAPSFSKTSCCTSFFSWSCKP